MRKRPHIPFLMAAFRRMRQRGDDQIDVVM
jgi:hypothetical protein